MNVNLRRITIEHDKLLSILPLSPANQQRLDKKLRLDFNFHSNAIEGSTLTYNDTELLLLFDDTIGTHKMREYEEMKSHDLAYNIVQQEASETTRPLNENWIKQLNRLILVRSFYKEAITETGEKTQKEITPGEYKKTPNSVRLSNGELYHYSTPSDTPIEMGELIDWYREQESQKMHPVELAALLHYKFVRIHPFDDGNGRVARLLMNYVLIKHQYPPVVIKKENKQNYLAALHLADVGQIDAFVNYIVDQVSWSIDIAIKAAKGESIDEPGDLSKKLTMLKRKLGEPIEKQEFLRYSEQAVLKAYDESITPLINSWEQKLKEFDDLFYSRESSIQVGKQLIKGTYFPNLLKRARPILWSTHPALFYAKEITFQFQPKGLRKLNKNLNLNGGRINIRFEDHVYEVMTIADTQVIDKLYTQKLSDAQINHVSEKMGNWLFTIIEQQFEK